MKIRIEGSGHCVELEQVDLPLREAVRLAKDTWESTRVEQPRLTMGYAGQITSQAGDQPVKGAGDRQRQVSPVTA